MKSWVYRLEVVLFILCCASCGPQVTRGPVLKTLPPKTSPTATATVIVADNSLNLLILVEGKVELKRPGWSDYHPTSFGTVLHRGDVLRLADNAHASVLCENFASWKLPSGTFSALTNVCPKGPTPILESSEPGEVTAPKGVNDPLIPYVISPRATYLLDPKPELQWNSIPNAITYTISVKGGNLKWQEVVTGTRAKYSGHLSLVPGVVYQLVVESDNGKSSLEEKLPNLGFRLLPPSLADSAQVNVKKLVNINLPPDTEAYVQATLYQKYGLIAEAIGLLENLIQKKTSKAAVYYSLGVYYAQTGLNVQAEANLIKALQIAKVDADLELQARVQKALGTAYMDMGKKRLARETLGQALQNFNKLGDDQEAKSITELLNINSP